MTGLVLKLSPKERILINGAVIENGDKRSKLNIVTPNAKILRLKDAIHPDDANTPVKRVCYRLQLVLSGNADGMQSQQTLAQDLSQLAHVFLDGESQSLLNSADRHVAEGQFYAALKTLKNLLPREEQIMQGMA